jgi:hypothetical protein
MDNPPGGATIRGLRQHGPASARPWPSAPRILADDLTRRASCCWKTWATTFMPGFWPAIPIARGRALCPAVDVLLHLQAAVPPPGLPNLTAADWATAAGFALDWYAFAATGTPDRGQSFTPPWTAALPTHADGPRVLILRDYHAENLLWLPGRGPGAGRAAGLSTGADGPAGL